MLRVKDIRVYQKDAEVLFPPRVIQALRALRGPLWQQLVEQILACPENHPDMLAFNLLMIRIDGCMTCHSDSFRAMRGCTMCARQAISRYKGSDEDLLMQWESARTEILHWLDTGIPPQVG